MVRELIILALVAVLFWIIRAREKLPLSSIGLRRQTIVSTLLWSVAVILMFGVVIAACLFLFPLVGLSYGASSGPALPVGVSLLLYARAGIAEDRGSPTGRRMSRFRLSGATSRQTSMPPTKTGSTW